MREFLDILKVKRYGNVSNDDILDLLVPEYILGQYKY